MDGLIHRGLRVNRVVARILGLIWRDDPRVGPKHFREPRLGLDDGYHELDLDDH
jgi:hypothetical protein